MIGVAVGLAGHFAGVPEGLMLLGWLVAGSLFYWMMRYPERVVALVQRGGVEPEDLDSGW
jgi:hypothetical protein